MLRVIPLVSIGETFVPNLATVKAEVVTEGIMDTDDIPISKVRVGVSNFVHYSLKKIIYKKIYFFHVLLGCRFACSSVFVPYRHCESQ